jgi:hypothetical protein
MTYLFKSKAAGDVLMLGPSGDQLLRIIGKEPAAKGIIEPAALPAAIRAIEAAIAEDEANPAPAAPARAGAEDVSVQGEGEGAGDGEGVSLRQRAWPLLEMMRAAQAASQDIAWGV